MKEKRYVSLFKQARALISGEDQQISSLANLSALIKSEFDFWWVGFYLVDENKKELYLGPFQGPLACTVIPHGKGVCGEAWKRAETLVVEDVHAFPGHIACSSESNSEIVVPLKKDGKVWGVLDVDSKNFSDFDEIDKKYLEKICALL